MSDRSEQPIVVKSLRKAFGRQQVLNGIDLAVNADETVAVLGRSGTGKSVLLKLLVGIQRADGGSIRVLGQEIHREDRDRLNEIRKKIGFLFQQAALYDSLTIKQNVEFPLARHTTLSAAQRQDRARELLAKLGMEKDQQKMPSEISGGMQKRVGLARALALDPEILLLDEPTAGLDPITSFQIGELISNLKSERRITSLMVTHDLRVSRLFADRFVLINEGTIRSEGSFEELKKSQDAFVGEFMRQSACE